MIFDYHKEPQLVQKSLLQVPVIELYDSLIIDPTYCGLKDARYKDDNIIISDSTLLSIFPPRLKQISSRYKVMCGCKC